MAGAILDLVFNSWKSRFSDQNGNRQPEGVSNTKMVQSHSVIPLDKSKVTFRQRTIKAFDQTFIEEWYVSAKIIRLDVYILAATETAEYKFEIQLGTKQFFGDVKNYGTEKFSMVFDLEELESVDYSITIKKC